LLSLVLIALGFTLGGLFCGLWLVGHFGVHLEEFFEAFFLRKRCANGVIFEAAIEVDAFNDFIGVIVLGLVLSLSR